MQRQRLSIKKRLLVGYYYIAFKTYSYSKQCGIHEQPMIVVKYFSGIHALFRDICSWDFILFHDVCLYMF